MDRRFPLWAMLVDPPDVPEGSFFIEWLDGGNHAGMEYLARTAHRRLSLEKGYPGYRTIVIALLPHETASFSGSGGPGRAELARYAVGEDYHSRFEKSFKGLLCEIGELLPVDEKPLVKPDHGALLEKSLAQMAGLGVMGKNTLLINPLLGSWFTIGCLLLKTPLVNVKGPFARTNPCGACSRCLSECPTDAFEAPYHLDAGRCLSYLTIERPDESRSSLRRESGSRWLFGCDRCQEVCPHNGPARRQFEDESPGGEEMMDSGRFVNLETANEERIHALRKENSALSRVTARRLTERISEIRDFDRTQSDSPSGS